MRKFKLTTITILCLGLVTACTAQGNDSSEIEDESDTADTDSTEVEDNVAANEDSSEEDTYNTNEYAHETYQMFFDEDFSILDESTVDRGWFEDVSENGWGEKYEYVFMDLDGDGIDELLIQLIDDPHHFNAAFHYEDRHIICWFFDTMEINCYDYPLKNGTMVTEYDYASSISYHVFHYLPNGDAEVEKYFYTIEEPFFEDEDDTSEYPIYQIDNEDVTKEEFEKQLQEYVLDEQLDRSDWTLLI